jgi:alkanesulfonate monooxygenase SsuD/methylene tetrahydromethanopterin reductase-like flavin-dependent oxidoreductase (luciferase family)
MMGRVATDAPVVLREHREPQGESCGVSLSITRGFPVFPQAPNEDLEALAHVTKTHRTWHHLHFGSESVRGGVVRSDAVDHEPSPEEAWERLIIGSPERCIRQIQALEAVGVDLLLLNMNFGNLSHREAMRSLRLFGQEVLPAFRR